MTRRGGTVLAGLVSVGLLAGCGPADEPTPTPMPSARPVALTLPADGRDSAAVLDSLAQFVQRVDADTGLMIMVRDQVELGAGASGTLTAWRADTVWQRIHLAGGDSAFATRDTYWLSGGVPVAALLESERPSQPVRREQVWFRSGRLYRWVDAEGRQLAPEAQSTKSEVEMLTARVTRILTALPEARTSQDSTQ